MCENAPDFGSKHPFNVFSWVSDRVVEFDMCFLVLFTSGDWKEQCIMI